MDIAKLDDTVSTEKDPLDGSQGNPAESRQSALAERPSQSLEEGELYVLRKGNLEHIPRNDEDGMRRVRITEEAFQVVTDIGHSMRKELNGYKPDVSLVTSALLLSHVNEWEKSQDAVRGFVIRMFSQTSL